AFATQINPDGPTADRPRRVGDHRGPRARTRYRTWPVPTPGCL
ncbi:MAG: hypothetical protein AVDCRST_MAG70-1969, partial [uncultured Thermomicrobiales bacterium]